MSRVKYLFLSFSFDSCFPSLSSPVFPSLFLSCRCPKSPPYCASLLLSARVRVCMRGPCVRARAPGECVEWSFLRNLASTFPSWKVLLVGQKQRPPSQRSSSVPRDRRLIHVATLTNAVRSSLTSPVTPSVPLVPLCIPLSSLVISSSLHRSAYRAPDQLKRSTITWFGTASAASSSSYSILLVPPCPLSRPFPLAPSPLSFSPAPLFPSHDLIVRRSLSISRSLDFLSLLVFVVHTLVLPSEPRAREEQWEDYNDYIDLRY